MGLSLLLPERRRFQGQAEPDWLRRLLGRARPAGTGRPGAREQVLRHASLLPRGWPMAALTRQIDAGDAQGQAWLRADPVHVRADMSAVRMLAWGHLGLEPAEVEALLKPLKLLFGDAGFPISAPVPERWYLMLPREARLPAFTDPEQVLGDEMHDHLPDGDAGRRWRQLLNEAQILLHQHPVNVERVERGVLPVNSLWFWGGGTLPDSVGFGVARIQSREVGLAALARAAGCALESPPERWDGDTQSTLVDLRGVRELAGVLGAWVQPAALAVRQGNLEWLQLDFADGQVITVRHGEHWRFWRRPRSLQT